MSRPPRTSHVARCHVAPVAHMAHVTDARHLPLATSPRRPRCGCLPRHARRPRSLATSPTSRTPRSHLGTYIKYVFCLCWPKALWKFHELSSAKSCRSIFLPSGSSRRRPLSGRKHPTSHRKHPTTCRRHPTSRRPAGNARQPAGDTRRPAGRRQRPAGRQPRPAG
jgi:hypothetical protein